VTACDDSVKAAGSAKATIVAIGIDGSFEGENGDFRAFGGIALPGAQAKLVTAVAAAAPKPIIVVKEHRLQSTAASGHCRGCSGRLLVVILDGCSVLRDCVR